MDKIVESIGDSFRGRGYKKRGRTFFKESSQAIVLLNIQKSMYSDARRKRITLNLGVAPKFIPAIWSEWYSTISQVASCPIRSRIGVALGKNDWWFDLDADSTLGDHRKIRRAIEKFLDFCDELHEEASLIRAVEMERLLIPNSDDLAELRRFAALRKNIAKREG